MIQLRECASLGHHPRDCWLPVPVSDVPVQTKEGSVWAIGYPFSSDEIGFSSVATVVPFQRGQSEREVEEEETATHFE